MCFFLVFEKVSNNNAPISTSINGMNTVVFVLLIKTELGLNNLIKFTDSCGESAWESSSADWPSRGKHMMIKECKSLFVWLFVAILGSYFHSNHIPWLTCCWWAWKENKLKSSNQFSTTNKYIPYLTVTGHIYKSFDNCMICGHWEKFITSMKRPSTALSGQLLTFWKSSLLLK